MKMRLILFLPFLLIAILAAQDMPHGDDFDMDCETCHTDESWKIKIDQLKFEHTQTGFVLFGAHKTVACSYCHQSLIFNQIGTACIDCHTDLHKGELGSNCETCHSPQSWENRQEIFDMHNETDFPLIGVHAILDCQACHQTEQHREFVNTSIQCSSCHLENYMRTLDPAHQRAGFDLRCENCHLSNSANWKQAVFDHTDRFPLEGGHSRLECTDCHPNQYQGTRVDCFACHQVEYENTSEPNHQAFGFPTLCETCHTNSNWEATTFDHLSVSGFDLVGVHANNTQVLCIDCHVNNQLTGIAKDCFSCHQNDFNETTNPDHQAGNFSQMCLNCHSQDAWEPATFDHNGTNFPLTGAHLSADCNSCHTNGQYSGLASDCYSCHKPDYDETTNPNHITAGIPTTCEDCHSTTAWEPATFDHNLTSFQLTGAHISTNCNSCHLNGQFSGISSECISCHESDYNNTTDPAHQAAQFPTTCEDCHNTTVWDPADFDHDGMYFPIYSGKHREAWDNCVDCHVAPTDYKVFECITCHEHNNPTDLADKHKDEQDYEYASLACYTCHPTGIADDD